MNAMMQGFKGSPIIAPREVTLSVRLQRRLRLLGVEWQPSVTTHVFLESTHMFLESTSSGGFTLRHGTPGPAVTQACGGEAL